MSDIARIAVAWRWRLRIAGMQLALLAGYDGDEPPHLWTSLKKDLWKTYTLSRIRICSWLGRLL